MIESYNLTLSRPRFPSSLASTAGIEREKIDIMSNKQRERERERERERVYQDNPFGVMNGNTNNLTRGSGAGSIKIGGFLHNIDFL